MANKFDLNDDGEKESFSIDKRDGEEWFYIFNVDNKKIFFNYIVEAEIKVIKSKKLPKKRISKLVFWNWMLMMRSLLRVQLHRF